MAAALKKSTQRIGDEAAALFVESLDAVLGSIMGSPLSRAVRLANLSPQDVRSLVWLGAHPHCVMSAFARGIKVPLSTATHLVDRLVEKGYLMRRRSEQDRRIVEIELSEAGRSFHKNFYKHRLDACRRLLVSLSPQEQQELTRLLNKASSRRSAEKIQ